MSLSDQEIYTQALQRACIPTSSTPLTFPGFPPTYEAFQRLLSMNKSLLNIASVTQISRSQLEQFEIAFHNLQVERENKERQEQLAYQRDRQLTNQYNSVLSNSEERRKFEAFLTAEKERERREAEERQQKEAEEKRKKKEEQEQSIERFREILKETFDQRYNESDDYIVQNYPMICSQYPLGIYTQWRHDRYVRRGITPDNYQWFDDANRAARSRGRNVNDGLPIGDEADEEVRKLLQEEFKLYQSFCKRLTERYTNTPLPNVAKAKIEELERENKELREKLQKIQEKTEKCMPYLNEMMRCLQT